MKPRYKIEYYKNDQNALEILQFDLEEENEFKKTYMQTWREMIGLYLYKEVYLDENYDIIEEKEYERGIDGSN